MKNRLLPRFGGHIKILIMGLLLSFSLDVLGQQVSKETTPRAVTGSPKNKEKSKSTPEIELKVFRVKFKENFVLKLEKSSKKYSAEGYVKTGLTDLDKLNKQYGVTSMKRLFRHGGKFEQKHVQHKLHLWYEVEIESSAKTLDAISSFSKLTEVITAEPVYEKYLGVETATVKRAKEAHYASMPGSPNDPELNEQWHYHNTGQYGGKEGADIRMLDAWKIETGDPGVIVAVIDGGIDVSHSDLKENMWINKREIPGNGIDDDNNGYIDDIYGYNFGDNSGNIPPDFHGTHVGGTIAALSNNKVGVAGVAGGNGTGDGARLMSLSAFGEFGIGGFDEAFVYAADNGAVISQNSWGFTFPGVYEQSILDAIDYFIAEAGFDENRNPRGPMQGGIVIFAAGNSGDDGDYYPGFYEPVVAVAATDRNDLHADFSTFGDWVELAAPGVDVYSTFPNNQYGNLSGTSMACPHVSGVAALIISKFAGNISPLQLRSRLTETTDRISLPHGFGSGRLNAFNSLQENDEKPPFPIEDLAIQEVFYSGFKLGWTAPEDPGNGKATSYIMRYALYPITEANFDDAPIVTGLPPAAAAGTYQSFTIKNLVPNTTYYFAMKSMDFFNNVSFISNIAVGTTENPPVITVKPASFDVNIDASQNPHTSRPMTIANEGNGASLEFSITSNFVSRNQINLLYPGQGLSTIDLGKYGKGNTGKSMETKNRIEPKKRTSTASFANGTDSIYYDSGHDYVDGFFGLFNDPLTTAVRFEVEQPSFNLTHVRNFMRTEMYKDSKIILEIYKGSDIMSSELLLAQEVQLESSDGEFFIIPLENSQRFISGDVFWVVFKYPVGIEFPQGFELTHTRPNTYFFSWDGGDSFHPIDYVLKIRALSGSENNSKWISFEPSSGSIAAGASTEVAVHFDATKIPNGLYQFNFLVNSDDPLTSTITVPATVEVRGQQPAILVTTDLLEFGTVFMGGSKSMPVTITNQGMGNLEISSISTSNTAFDVDVSSTVLNPGQETVVNVIFSPIELGNSNAILTINSNDPKQAVVEVILVGTGAEPPIIAVSPGKVDKTLLAGESDSETLQIANKGNYPLRFSFPEFAVERLLKDPSIQKNNTTPLDIPARSGTIKKGSKEAHPKGHPVVLGAGSDKDFGYTWIDSDEDGGPSYIWEDIAETGTEILNGVDDSFEEIALPFNFKFYGQTKNNIKISSNGFLTFGEDGYSFANQPIPNTWEPNDIIAPFWTDFHLFNETSKIYYVASPQGLLVQYDAINSLYSAGTATFQVKILPNGRIYFYYKDVNTLEAANIATVGIENETGTDGLQIVYNNTYIRDELAVVIMPPSQGFISGVSRVSGVVPVNGNIDVNVLLSAAGLNDGEYKQNLTIESNDPINSPLVIPFTLSVLGVPEISIQPAALLFDSVFLGASKTMALIIENIGSKALVVEEISTSSQYFKVKFDGLTLEPNDKVSIPVTFTPIVPGLMVDELVIISNGQGGNPLSVPLSGIGSEPPIISVVPESIYADVNSGGIARDTLTISNLGKSGLTYSIPQTYWIKPQPAIKNNAAKRAAAEARPTKGSVDNRKGTPVKYSGGADFGFGYTWQDNKDGNGPEFSWIDITNTGNNVTADLQTGSFADGSIEVPIDFSFPFYGTTYTSVHVSASGILYFGNPLDITFINLRIPVSDEINNLIAGFWTDLEPGSMGTGTVHYEAKQGYFIVQYTNVPRFGADLDQTITFQIILFQDGNIKMQYLDVSSADYLTYGTVGIENATGTDGIEVVFNDYYLQDGLAIEFNGPTVRSIAPGKSVRVPIVLDASHLNDGTYYDELLVHSNDPVNPVVSIPVVLNVSGMAVIEVYPDNLDFGQLFVHPDSIFSEIRAIVVKNSGSKDLTISSVYVKDPAAFSAEVDGSQVLAPYEETYILVRFIPSAVAMYHTELVIESNDGNEQDFIIPLQGEGVEPPVFEVYTEGGMIDLKLKSSEVGSAIININNSGGSNLQFNTSISYMNEGVTRHSAIPLAILPLAKPYKGAIYKAGETSKKAQTDATIGIQNFTDSLHYESSPYADDFIGTGSYSPLTIATKFVSPENGFILSHVRNFYRTEGSSENIYMAVYAGGSDPATSRLLSWQPVDGGDEYGAFQLISLNESLKFESGEIFWVMFYYPQSIDYVQGVNYGISNSDVYWYSLDQGASWSPLEEAMDETAPKIRALQSAEGWITLDPASGQVSKNSSEEVKVSVDASKLEPGGSFARIIFSTNDPFNPSAIIPVRVHVNSPPVFINPPLDTLFINQNELLTVELKATDIDGQVLSYSLLETYKNVTFTFTSEAAILQFQPDQNQTGTFTFIVEAIDDMQETTMHSFVVEVLNGSNQAPVVTRQIKAQNVKKGKSISIDLSKIFSDPDLDQLSFRATATDPTNVDLLVNGNILQLTALVPGNTLINIVADDGKGGIAGTSFNLKVTGGKPNDKKAVKESDEITEGKENSNLLDLVNYPNPFSKETTISYSLSEASYVKLQIFTVQGLLISILADEVQKAGHHIIQFDASGLPSGVYLYGLQIEGKFIAKRMVVK